MAGPLHSALRASRVGHDTYPRDGIDGGLSLEWSGGKQTKEKPYDDIDPHQEAHLHRQIP